MDIGLAGAGSTEMPDLSATQGPHILEVEDQLEAFAVEHRETPLSS